MLHVFLVLSPYGSNKPDGLTNPQVLTFDPGAHRRFVERIQVWGDIVLVGNHGQHSLMSRDFVSWTKTPEGGDYAVAVRGNDNPRPNAGNNGKVERFLGCVAGYVGQRGEYWAASTNPADPHSDMGFVTPEGIRPAMRKLFQDLGITT